MMGDAFWTELRRAVDLVTSSGVRRADGPMFKVYAVPSADIVRIDIQTPKED